MNREVNGGLFMDFIIFNPEITVGNIATLLAALPVLLGATYAGLQWKNNIRFERARYMEQLIEKITTDEDIVDVLFMIEYSEKWYTENFHGNKNLELKVDKTLSFLSYICYLRVKKIITEAEFEFFKYQLVHTLSDTQVEDYLYNLYHFTQKYCTEMTFRYLLEYAISNNLFDKDFKNKDAYKYNKKYHRNINL